MTASQATLRVCCERVREGLGYVGGFYSKNQVVKGKRLLLGTALVVQGLRLSASPAGGAGSIPVQGTKILLVSRCGQKGEKGDF